MIIGIPVQIQQILGQSGLQVTLCDQNPNSRLKRIVVLMRVQNLDTLDNSIKARPDRWIGYSVFRCELF